MANSADMDALLTMAAMQKQGTGPFHAFNGDAGGYMDADAALEWDGSKFQLVFRGSNVVVDPVLLVPGVARKNFIGGMANIITSEYYMNAEDNGEFAKPTDEAPEWLQYGYSTMADHYASPQSKNPKPELSFVLYSDNLETGKEPKPNSIVVAAQLRIITLSYMAIMFHIAHMHPVVKKGKKDAASNPTGYDKFDDDQIKAILDFEKGVIAWQKQMYEEDRFVRGMQDRKNTCITFDEFVETCVFDPVTKVMVKSAFKAIMEWNNLLYSKKDDITVEDPLIRLILKIGAGFRFGNWSERLTETWKKLGKSRDVREAKEKFPDDQPETAYGKHIVVPKLAAIPNVDSLFDNNDIVAGLKTFNGEENLDSHQWLTLGQKNNLDFLATVSFNPDHLANAIRWLLAMPGYTLATRDKQFCKYNSDTELVESMSIAERDEVFQNTTGAKGVACVAALTFDSYESKRDSRFRVKLALGKVVYIKPDTFLEGRGNPDAVVVGDVDEDAAGTIKKMSREQLMMMMGCAPCTLALTDTEKTEVADATSMLLDDEDEDEPAAAEVERSKTLTMDTTNDEEAARERKRKRKQAAEGTSELEDELVVRKKKKKKVAVQE